MSKNQKDPSTDSSEEFKELPMEVRHFLENTEEEFKAISRRRFFREAAIETATGIGTYEVLDQTTSLSFPAKAAISIGVGGSAGGIAEGILSGNFKSWMELKRRQKQEKESKASQER